MQSAADARQIGGNVEVGRRLLAGGFSVAEERTAGARPVTRKTKEHERQEVYLVDID